MRVLRVFPRRTSYTPVDLQAFVGDPPLWLPDADEVHVSCVFSWDRAEAERLRQAWAADYGSRVKLGGPAFGSPAGEFTPGLYLKPGYTFTSRGCVRACSFCLVPYYEGDLRLLPITDGWVIQDNNFLACPKEHREAVYEMLARQPRAAVFAGGIDARLVTDEVAEEFERIRIDSLFLACDSRAAIRALRVAAARLAFLGRRKLRCYVLVGYRDETPAQAAERLEECWQAGVLPFAQYYRPPEAGRRFDYPQKWRQLVRAWSRPAAMFANHRAVEP